MLKKLQILLAGILLACATITVISGCKNANLVETESDEKSIVITSRQTVPASQKLLELTIAFTNFSNTPTKVDVYFSGQTNPTFSNVEVTNGKISIDLSGYTTGSYTIYVKSGNVTSNSISFTITTNAGKITISYGDSTGTDNPTGTEFDASAVVHFKQTADGRNYEYTDKEIKNVPAGATLDSIEKSYTGFTAQGLFLEKQPDDSYVINIYYSRNIITVTLNANGGTIGGEETFVQKGLYGTAFPKAKDLSLSHEIKTFGGWNSSADGTGTSYDDVKGFNYLGDMAMSFVKRRIGLQRGAALPGVDQYDFLAGAFILTALTSWTWMSQTFTPWMLVVIIVLTPILHLGTNIVGYKLKIKNEPW